MKILFFNLDENYVSFKKIFSLFFHNFSKINKFIMLDLEQFSLDNEYFNNYEIESIIFFPINVFPNLFCNKFYSIFNKKSFVTNLDNINDSFISLIQEDIHILKSKISDYSETTNSDVFNNFFHKAVFDIAKKNYTKLSSINLIRITDINYSEKSKNKTYFRSTNLFIKVNTLPSSKFINMLQRSFFNWKFLNNYKLQIIKKYKFTNIINYDGKNKYESKLIVENLGINVPKTYHVLDNINELQFDSLPKNYVIKPSNLDNSRLVYIVKNGLDLLRKVRVSKQLFLSRYQNFDKILMGKELNPLILKKNKPKIIIEEYISSQDPKKFFPVELKIYIFNRNIRFIIIFDKNKSKNHFYMVDGEWNYIASKKYGHKDNDNVECLPKPIFYDLLIEDVLKIYDRFNDDLNNIWISKFIRMDFFINDDKYYFGEFALFPNGGKGKNINNFAMYEFGRFWLYKFDSNFNKYIKEIN